MSASDIAGLRIREARDKQGWTRQELADHCAKTGAAHITATVITNLETRRRSSREITADELLVLAHVLDVPPVQLISPLRAGEELQVTPSLHMDALEAAAWLGNEGTINPANILRRVHRTSYLIRAHYRALQQMEDGAVARDRITQEGNHVMLMLGRLEDLGYEPPQLDPETVTALRECGLPGTLAEWRTREEVDFDGPGEGSLV